MCKQQSRDHENCKACEMRSPNARSLGRRPRRFTNYATKQQTDCTVFSKRPSMYLQAHRQVRPGIQAIGELHLNVIAQHTTGSIDFELVSWNRVLSVNRTNVQVQLLTRTTTRIHYQPVQSFDFNLSNIHYNIDGVIKNKIKYTYTPCQFKHSEEV